MQVYEQMNKLWFHPKTALKVRAVLESVFDQNARVRIWLGDTTTGRAWAEENDVVGRIGRSTGQYKVPLLIATGECGGPAILDHCIVRIDLTGRKLAGGNTLYRHPSFHAGDWTVAASDMEGYAEVVLHDGSVHARFKRQGRAGRYVEFMRGESYRF